MRFWDTSAIVPLLVDEPRTALCRTLIASDSIVAVWWSANVEASSAISRRQREGAEPASMSIALSQLEMLSSEWSMVEPTDEVVRIACRMLRLHPLRAADALHLAAAMVASNQMPESLPFVCLDRRLRDAAALEGFALFPPTL